MYIDLTEFKQRKPTKYTHIVQGLYCFLPPKCIIILFYYQLSIHSILPILRIQLELFTLIDTMFKKMQPIYQTLWLERDQRSIFFSIQMNMPLWKWLALFQFSWFSKYIIDIWLIQHHNKRKNLQQTILYYIYIPHIFCL